MIPWSREEDPSALSRQQMRTRAWILDITMLIVIVIFALSIGMLISRCATRANLQREGEVR